MLEYSCAPIVVLRLDVTVSLRSGSLIAVLNVRPQMSVVTCAKEGLSQKKSDNLATIDGEHARRGRLKDHTVAIQRWGKFMWVSIAANHK